MKSNSEFLRTQVLAWIIFILMIFITYFCRDVFWNIIILIICFIFGMIIQESKDKLKQSLEGKEKYGKLE